MKAKTNLVRLWREEGGQALVIVLAFMVLGSLTLPPLLSFMDTSLKTGKVYKDKSDELYTADSGIEDAIWQIKNDQLEYVFVGQNYHLYDFETTFAYDVADEINDLVASVTIKNVWIPKGLEAPGPDDAEETQDIMESNKLMVSGTAKDTSTYEIVITFSPEGSDNLTVTQVGMWLPYGFSYDGNCNLESYEPLEDYYAEPTVSDHAGGQAIAWEFSPSAPFDSFPPEDKGTPPTVRINFNYTADRAGAIPSAIAWMATDDSSLEGGSIQNILPVTWDVDTKFYRITSTAGDTQVEAYGSRNELRDMNDAMAGDYKAIRNSLMQNLDYGSDGARDYLLPESSATISNIPPYAVAVQAYLYWGAWYDENKVLDEPASNFSTNAWTAGAGWSASGRYRGHSTTANGDPARFLTSKTLDLSGLDPSAVVEVRWEQSDEGTLEPDDVLQYQFYNGTYWSENFTAFADDIDDTSLRFTRTIPQQYLTSQFKLRFNFLGFTDTAGTDEYCRLDNIAVTWWVPTADTSIVFEINGAQVYFNGDGDPAQGPYELTATASEWSTINNRRGFSYACKVDVTDLVQAFSNNGTLENPIGNGNGLYTVGNVDGVANNDQLAWGGWSLIVVYASPETAGHRLYLFDRPAFNQGYQNLDFDYDGNPGGDISGFIVPEPIAGDPDPYAGHMTAFVGEGDNHITGDKLKFTGQSGNYKYLSNAVNPWYNVWNSQSLGMSYDGVDVDTFDIPWQDGGNDLVIPGDTTAHLDLPSETAGGYDGSDAWNLIYLILSLRSETTTGGTVHYVIRNN